ncbi:MAG: TolC family protein [Flammeovirgaceae bacterium]|nr:MAG: TolC family protein [Flammeovirgaceae bacterium]
MIKNHLLIAAFTLVSQALPAQQTLTLQQCIDYALENNPNIKSARAGVDASQAKVGEYLSSGLPQLTAAADLGDNFVIPTTFVPAQIFDPGAPEGALAPVQFGTKYTGRASIDLQQMIFSGSYFVGLKAARTYTELSRREQAATEIDLVANIKKAYYSVLVNKERNELVKKNYQRLDSLLRQTRIMYENGFAEKIDVNRIQVQFNNISQAIKTSATALDISLKLLKFQMGMPVNEPLTLADDLQTIHFEALREDFSSNFSYHNRIEYSQLEINKALVGLDIKNTRVQYLPSLDFYGSYGASYGTAVFSNFVAFGENWRTFGVYGLRINMPIFDGMRKSKIIQQKKSQMRQVENAQQLLKSRIDLEQAQYSLEFENNLTALKAQEENMKLAEEVYNVAVLKYQQGVGSNIEVIDADAAFKEAQTNYFTALYDALISTVDLEKAYGKIVVPTTKK